MKIFTRFKKTLLVTVGVLFTMQAMALTEEEFKEKAIGTWLTTWFVDSYYEKSTDFTNHVDDYLEERKPLVIKADGTIDYNFGEEILTYSFVNGNVVVSGTMGPSVELDAEGDDLILFSLIDNDEYYHSTEYHFKSAKGSVYEDFMNNYLGVWFETGFFDHTYYNDEYMVGNDAEVPYETRIPLVINPDGTMDYQKSHWKYSFTDNEVIIKNGNMPKAKIEGDGVLVLYSLLDDGFVYSYQGYTYERGTGTPYGEFMNNYLGDWYTRGYYSTNLYTDDESDYGEIAEYIYTPINERYLMEVKPDGTIVEHTGGSYTLTYKYSFDINGVTIESQYHVKEYQFVTMPDGFLLFGIEDGFGNLEGYSYSREDGSNVAGIATDIKEQPVTKAQVPDGVYSLQGLYVGKTSDLKSLPKGIYIVNGKKIMVK